MRRHPSLVLALVASLSTLALAQDSATDTAAPAAPTATADVRSLTTLSAIVDHLRDLDGEIDARKKALAAATTDDDRQRLVGELVHLRAERSGLAASFARLAAGTDLAALEDQPEEKPDWQQELFLFIRPLLREVKSATAGAREMDNLRLEIEKLESRLPAVERALASAKATRAEASDARVAAELDGTIESLGQKRSLVQSQLAVARSELDSAERARKPFTDTARELVRGFFATRGRNLALALFAMVGVFVSFRILYRLFLRLGPAHRRMNRRGFGARLVDVLAYVFAALGSFLTLIGVLYTSGDWLLLSVASILILGLIFTARTAIPRLANTILFLLNLGTVREGERLVYEGLPWRVASLRFSAVLENPELDGGRLVLPIRELLGRYSRATVEGEPWFPARRGDYIELPGGGFGRVTCLTQEVVVVETEHGRTTYPTTRFLGEATRNLSAGFTVAKSLSVHPQHRPASATEIPKGFDADVRAALGSGAWGAQLKSVAVELEDAGPASLDYSVIVAFDGAAAAHYPAIRRALGRVLMESAMARGLEVSKAG